MSLGSSFQRTVPYLETLFSPYFVVRQCLVSRFLLERKLYVVVFSVNISLSNGGDMPFTHLNNCFKICLFRCVSKVHKPALCSNCPYELWKSIKTKRRALRWIFSNFAVFCLPQNLQQWASQLTHRNGLHLCTEWREILNQWQNKFVVIGCFWHVHKQSSLRQLCRSHSCLWKV
jgi:hypothetical protein